MGDSDRLIGPDVDVPPWASFFTGAQYSMFLTLVEADVIARGLGYEMHDGLVHARLGDATHQFGLQNLAQVCFRESVATWPAIIAGHFDVLLAPDATPAHVEKIGDYAAVRPVLRLRLYPSDIAGEGRLEWPVAEGLIAVLVFDLPEVVRTVARDEADRWGVGPDELYRVALENVRAEPTLPPKEVIGREGEKLTAVFGESFFTASHVLALDDHVAPDHPFGALVAVPHRHVLLLHVIADESALKAAGTLAGIARGMYRDGPGSLSPFVYWAHHGRLQHVPVELDQGQVTVRPPDEFVAMLERLSRPVS